MATIRDAGITGEFTHEPLQHPATEIRLIQVHLSDDGDSDIQCKVSGHSILKTPPYVAISYTWGNSRERRNITLNGKQLSIGLNSWVVLWQTRLHRVAHHIWIDVLSIDQTSATEKSVQVGLMGVIFSGAIYVLASLGLHGDDSAFLSEQINAYTKYVEKERKAHGESEDPQLFQHHCSNCGKMTGEAEYKCVTCEGRTYFCRRCRHNAKQHEDEEAGHKVYMDSIEHLRISGCRYCGRRYAKSWYATRSGTGHTSFMLCRTCMQTRQDDINDHSGLFLRDHWGEVTRPTVWYERMETVLETHKWILRLSRLCHQRIIDATRAISLREYFTRLWIVQEVRLACRVVVACGDSLFPLHGLYYLEHAATACPGSFHVEREFNRERGMTTETEYKRLYPGVTARYMSGRARVLQGPQTGKVSLWQNVVNFKDHACYDLRDRVFALIDLSDQQALRPDYLKSATQVLLQLLEQETHSQGDSGTSDSRNPCDMTQAFELVKSFRLSPETPEIAGMLEQRRLAHRSQIVPTNLEHHPDLIGKLERSRRIPMSVQSYCTITRNDAGILTAPMVQRRPHVYNFGHDFGYVERSVEDDAISVRTPAGATVALADTKARSGDIILFLTDPDADEEKPPVVGLIVRPTDRDIYLVVGQAILNSGAQPCMGYRFSNPCSCGEKNACNCASQLCRECEAELGPHCRPGTGFTVHMAPEDVLLFVAQDMGTQDRPRSVDDLPVLVRPEHTVGRLRTSVTSHELSSYAKFHKVRTGWPRTPDSSPPTSPFKMQNLERARHDA